MITKISIINLIVCIFLLFPIYLFSYVLDPEFAKFTTNVSGFGLLLSWGFSPKHNLFDGIRSLSMLEWIIVAGPMIILMTTDGIPSSFRYLIIVSGIIGGVGFMIATNSFNRGG